jgi:hypothetical protein
VFCDGHLQLNSCVGIVRIHWAFHRTPEKKNRAEKDLEILEARARGTLD